MGGSRITPNNIVHFPVLREYHWKTLGNAVSTGLEFDGRDILIL